MNPLRLSPLPVLRAQDDSGSLRIELEGFVDEAAVSALVYGSSGLARQMPYPPDLALAADDLDFAGWNYSPLPPPRLIQQPGLIDEPLRRPTPPENEQPGLGLPYSGSHRWWVAGLAGLLSTLLFSMLLLNLSARSGSRFEVLFAPQPPAAAVQKSPPVEISAELTKVSNSRR